MKCTGSGFRIGDYEAFILCDGSRSIGAMTSSSPERFIFGDAPLDELRSCLASYGGYNAQTVLPFYVLLIKYENKYTMIDCGCGDRAKNDEHPDEPAGLLSDSLSDIGLKPDEIDTIIVTHSHWDHFGGLVGGGESAYPNAEIILSRDEERYIREVARGWGLDYLNILKDQTNSVNGLTRIDKGITVKPAPGHTPGMMYVEVTSKGDHLIYTSDIIIHQAHIEHIDWIPSFETDRRAAVANRLKLIEGAYNHRSIVFVPHIPEVLGRIEKSKSKYKWSQANYAYTQIID